MKIIRVSLVLLLLVAGAPTVGVSSDSTAAIQSFLDDNIKSATGPGTVVGLIDERGSRIISRGSAYADGGQLNGDSLFNIGSVTKTFTVLLLQDMVDRGEMTLDASVASYLPASVKMPTFQGKQITLLDLATHTSGLPFDADDFTGEKWREHFENYTADNLYAWLSTHKLRRKPGAQYEYSNAGMALLGHAIELKAGKNFEALVIERICRPLGMDSTCIVLSKEQKGRLASGHDPAGKPEAMFDLGVYAPAGGLRSTANDMLKFAAAATGLQNSSLTPLINKTTAIRRNDSPSIIPSGPLTKTAMAWTNDGVHQPPGMELIGHGGGYGGYSAFIGLDKEQRRAVVILSNQRGGAGRVYPRPLGWLLLQGAPLNHQGLASVLLHGVGGVGIAIHIDEKTHDLRIKEVLPNSAAEQAGVTAGMVVRAIDDVAASGKSLQECLDLIRGPVGAKVRLELLDAENQSKFVELTRRQL